VHDAANILRRYFNNLPEPIIPLQHYDPFRNPLKGHQAEAVGPSEGQSQSVGGFDPDYAVRTYQQQIKALPSLNRQLLLYILDLLAVFAAKADVNKMTTSNLAAIFQPGLLSHPQHDMSPADYRLSQDVLIFLIDNQDHFLIGMEGTAVDEGTVKHIESGPSTPQARTPTTPGRNGSGIGRSASTTSSAGAESLRMHGGVRRNVSTSSKRSRCSGAVPSPITPIFVTPTTSGVSRSNTLPSQRSPAINSRRFASGKHSGPSTPAADEAKSPLSSTMPVDAPVSIVDSKPPPEQPAQSTKAPQPAAPVAEQTMDAQPAASEQTAVKRAQTMPPDRIEMPKPFAMPSTQEMPMASTVEQPQVRPAVTPATYMMPGGFPLPSPGIIPPSQPTTPNVPAQTAGSLLPPRSTTPIQRSPQCSPHHTPTRERSEFMEAPIDSDPSTELTPAVRTFTQILGKSPESGSKESKEHRKPNKLQKKRMPNTISHSTHSSTHSLGGGDSAFGGSQIAAGPPSPLHPPQPPFAQGQSQASSSKEALQETSSSRASGNTLKPSMSPSASFRSHSTATEYSETEQTEEQPKEEKRSFWKGHRRGESRATPTASQTDLTGSVPGADKSMSSFASSSGWTGGGRRSMQYESNQSSETSMVFGSPPDYDKSEKKGAFDWFHKRRLDHKDRTDKRERAKSPPGSSGHLPQPQNLMQPTETFTARGRQSEIPHSTDNTQPKVDKSSDVTPTGTSPNPPVVPSTPVSPSSPKPRTPMALRTDLPAALTEPRSVARSPDRNALSPTTTTFAQHFPTVTPPHAAQSESASQPRASTQPETAAPAPQPVPFTTIPSGPHHASSGSTITVTPQTVNQETTSDAPPADNQPSQVPAPPAV
jgi:hypothetical protein